MNPCECFNELCAGIAEQIRPLHRIEKFAGEVTREISISPRRGVSRPDVLFNCRVDRSFLSLGIERHRNVWSRRPMRDRTIQSNHLRNRFSLCEIQHRSLRRGRRKISSFIRKRVAQTVDALGTIGSPSISLSASCRRPRSTIPNPRQF